MEPTDIDINSLHQLDEDLPPVPWTHRHDPDSLVASNTIVDGDGQVVLEGDALWESYLSYLPKHDTPLLLAQLRNAVPALLERITALEAQVAQSQSQATQAQARAWDEGYQKHIERTWAVDAGGVLPDTSNPYRAKEERRG